MQSEMILQCIKLVLGGIAAFLAIMLWSKTRESAWMALIAGTVTSYAGILYDVLRVFGIAAFQNASLEIAGINLITLFFAVVPQLCYVIAFVLALIRKHNSF